jgi:glutamate-ammonia-ligase adenylyltransferase
VARACIREPTLLADLLSSGDLAAPVAPGEYAARLDRQVADAADETRLAVALRRFRRREMARIAWRDLAGLAGLEETLGDLSQLAEGRRQHAALDRLHRWQCQRFGAPHAMLKASRNGWWCWAWASSGGCELNFSSDIDLIFAYPSSGPDSRRESDQQRGIFSSARSAPDQNLIRVDR